jgi:hypothetical protein
MTAADIIGQVRSAGGQIAADPTAPMPSRRGRVRFDNACRAAHCRVLELAKGPLVYALQKYDFLVLFPVHPATLAKYRQAFTPSQAKDDPTDAELQLELLLRHRDKLKPLHPQGVSMRTLQSLVEQRRRLVSDKGRITNRLIYALKQYFPQAVEWFKDKDTAVFCDFLSRWPTLKQAKHARQATLDAFFREPGDIPSSFRMSRPG